MIRTPTTAVPRQDLVGAYYEFNLAADFGFVGDQVLPLTDVSKRYSQYFTMSRKEWYNRTSDVKRARKAATSRSEAGMDSDTLTVIEYTHEEVVDEIDSDEYGEQIPLDEVAARRVARKIELEAEIDAAAVVFNDTNFPVATGTGSNVGTAWSTAATAVPLTDLSTAIEDFIAAWGVPPNAVIMSMITYMRACKTAQVQGKFLQSFGPTTQQVVPNAAFAGMLGIPGLTVYTPWGMYDSANAAVAAPTMTQIWATNRVMVTRIGAGQDLDGPQIGRTFVLPGKSMVAIDEYRDEPHKSNVIRATRELVRKQMKNAVGHMLRGT